jgi:hypothetical protein
LLGDLAAIPEPIVLARMRLNLIRGTMGLSRHRAERNQEPPDRLRDNVQRFALATLALFLSTAAMAGDSLRITGITRDPGQLSLRWTEAGPGFAYTVQRRDTLASGIWLTDSHRRPWPLPTTETILDLDPDEMEQGFYRVLAVPEANRGEWIAVTALPSMSLFEVAVIFALAEIPVVPQFAVDAYKVVYETIDPWGGRTEASGAFLLPQHPGTPPPLVSYQHGTLTRTNDAPSASALERIPGVGFAALGYAVALPDFLGLGDSPGLHPYHHAQSQATAAVDLLRAARAWCEVNQVPLGDPLFLTGYSQGGHATLALQRELETHHREEFTVTASAPMAGAYDLSGVTADDLLSGRPMPNPYYLFYLVAAYQALYGLADSLSDWLASPYDTTLPPLLDGNATGAEINAAMPADPLAIFRPEHLDAIRTDINHPLRLALRDNDLTRWTPVAPTRLYHCAGDQDVILANSLVALDAFHARGATQVEWMDPDPLADHGGCALPAFLLVRDWFDSLR